MVRAADLLLVQLGNFQLVKQADQLEEVITPGNQGGRKPKVAKGATDIQPTLAVVRDQVFQALTSVFKRHGGVPIDTPVFELKETLTGKYGEDQKLIYEMKDQGGEQLCLRYDLTVPFARYVATHNIDKIKRYHIGKVYRRDEPQMNRGRFREFYQCDFDIAGYGDAPSLADAEVLSVLVETLSCLKGVTGDFAVNLNHRSILDGMMNVCGVEGGKFKPVCSAIDKLDKETWETVRDELVAVKGIPEAVADKIGYYVKLRGQPMEMVERLRNEPALAASMKIQETLVYLSKLFEHLTALNVIDNIMFDLSLARGLDYYTGVIFEAVLLGENVGSIGGGGRYDQLVGMFAGKAIPAVGVSIGVQRLFRILEEKLNLREIVPMEEEEGGAKQGDKKVQRKVKQKGTPVGVEETNKSGSGGRSGIRETATDVLVASIGDNLLNKRLAVCGRLWAANVACEFLYSEKPKLKKQLDYASEKQIPLVVLFGDDELSKGTVKLRELHHHQGSDGEQGSAKEEKEIKLDELAEEVTRYLREKRTSADRLYDAVLGRKCQ
eukprot:GHVS01031748.1.p1 GENE.GHVS01031748.1~~GHVS01031748.1.p1  ORF type:complete len:606 (-),score=95.02 GHVS01031748.1:102-1754(-)